MLMQSDPEKKNSADYQSEYYECFKNLVKLPEWWQWSITIDQIQLAIINITVQRQ